MNGWQKDYTVETDIRMIDHTGEHIRKGDAMKGLVLSGGSGTRLRPITHTGPKQLVPVANKPVLQYCIENLQAAGITDVGVVLGNKGRTEIQEFLGDGSQLGIDVTYIVQGEPLGIAHAVGCAESFIGDDNFVVVLGDNILKEGLDRLVDNFESGVHDAGIGLQVVDNPGAFGVADVDEDGTVERLVEKPDEPPSELALIGTYVFSPAIFDAIAEITPSWRDELEITDAIQYLIDDGRIINSHIVEGWWKDTGKPEDILEANRLVLEDLGPTTDGTIAAGAEVTGAVELAADARIDTDAVVRGPVSIAEGTVIGGGTYVGPYTSIGPDSVLEQTHVENSVVIGNAEITTSGKIIDSIIGRDATVRSADDLLPAGRRLVVGEHSNVRI